MKKKVKGSAEENAQILANEKMKEVNALLSSIDFNLKDFPKLGIGLTLDANSAIAILAEDFKQLDRLVNN